MGWKWCAALLLLAGCLGSGYEALEAARSSHSVNGIESISLVFKNDRLELDVGLGGLLNGTLPLEEAFTTAGNLNYSVQMEECSDALLEVDYRDEANQEELCGESFACSVEGVALEGNTLKLEMECPYDAKEGVLILEMRGILVGEESAPVEGKFLFCEDVGGKRVCSIEVTSFQKVWRHG